MKTTYHFISDVPAMKTNSCSKDFCSVPKSGPLSHCIACSVNITQDISFKHSNEPGLFDIRLLAP